jgi:uncharacterized protein (DUF111 family)
MRLHRPDENVGNNVIVVLLHADSSAARASDALKVKRLLVSAGDVDVEADEAPVAHHVSKHRRLAQSKLSKKNARKASHITQLAKATKRVHGRDKRVSVT